MDIKEIACGGVIVVGGVAYTVAQGGLGDALSEDVKYVTEVTLDDRADYMNSIAQNFRDNFSNYFVETEDYTYMGLSTFGTTPSSATFTELVRSEEAVTKAQAKTVKTALGQDDFCEQDEMTLFTDKGWHYKFKLSDHEGRVIFKITCRPASTQLRPMS